MIYITSYHLTRIPDLMLLSYSSTIRCVELNEDGLEYGKQLILSSISWICKIVEKGISTPRSNFALI